MARKKPLKITAEIGSDNPRCDRDIEDVTVEVRANPNGPGLLVDFDVPVRCLRLTSEALSELINLLGTTPYRN